MMDADDSDEDMYDATKDTQQVQRDQFQWYQRGYQTVFDMNEGLLENYQSSLQGYPTSAQTDSHHALKPKQIQGLSDPPQRIMIVSSANNAVDLILDKLAPLVE